MNNFEIIRGLDGSYIVRNGKLLKIVRVAYSDNWFLNTGGWAEFELEDGQIIRLS
jgi:hypothetical protein